MNTAFGTRKSSNPLTEQLKAKGRARRESLKAQAKSRGNAVPARNDLLPELKLVKIAASDLKTPNRKTRKHSPEQLRDIMQSISTLGFCAPLLVDKGNMVIDGEARLEAARQLGLNEVPCILVAHSSEAERRSLRLALNRLGEKAEWDLDALKLEL